MKIKRFWLFFTIIALVVVFLLIQPEPFFHKPEGKIAEIPVVYLSLADEYAQANAEYSAMAWYGDTLILVPQYPVRFSSETTYGSLLAIPRQQILDVLDGRQTEALEPIRIPLDAPGLDGLSGFEGFESIAFVGNTVYMTVEARNGLNMQAYVLQGRIEPDLSQIILEPSTAAVSKAQSGASNYSDESIFFWQNEIWTIYEANGAGINPQPKVHRFNSQLQPLADGVFPTIEYRITDVAAPDEDGKFWAINTFFPGDRLKLNLRTDGLVEKYGAGESHAQHEGVERLVQMQITEAGVELVDRPPLQLVLLENGEIRNWEGLVELPGRGFLLVTDKYTDSLLGFVAWQP